MPGPVVELPDHELGAAAYALRAVLAAAGTEGGDETVRREREWQHARLPDGIRELVLDDQRLRNKKLWSLFGD